MQWRSPCHATQPEYRAIWFAPNAGPNAFQNAGRIQAGEQGHLWVLLQLSSSQKRRPRLYSHFPNQGIQTGIQLSQPGRLNIRQLSLKRLLPFTQKGDRVQLRSGVKRVVDLAEPAPRGPKTAFQQGKQINRDTEALLLV